MKLNPTTLTELLVKKVCPNIQVFGEVFSDSHCSTGRAACIACKHEYQQRICKHKKGQDPHCFHPGLENFFSVVFPLLNIHSENT